MKNILLILAISVLTLACEKESIGPVAEDYLGQWVLIGNETNILRVDPDRIWYPYYGRIKYIDLMIEDCCITYTELGRYPNSWAKWVGTLHGDTLTTRATRCVIRGVEQDVSDYTLRKWVRQ